MVDVLSERLDDDRSFDIVDGAAGCIGSLLALHVLSPAAATLDLATRSGNRSCSAARNRCRGHGWIPERLDAALAGFAHGAAGIAWALLKLAAATPASADSTPPRSRQLPTSAACSRPRRRTGSTCGPSSDAGAIGQRTPMTAWCHGAGGIGLARLERRSSIWTMPRSAARSRWPRRLRSPTRARREPLPVSRHPRQPRAAPGVGQNQRRAALDQRRRLDRRGRPRRHRRRGLLVRHAVRRRKSGLMTGLAGIGYGLLRLLDPGSFPPSSCLNPPSSAGRAPD